MIFQCVSNLWTVSLRIDERGDLQLLADFEDVVFVELAAEQPQLAPDAAVL